MSLRTSRERREEVEGTADKPEPRRRWWQYKRTWLLGLPGFLVLLVLALFGWGSLQQRPEGFAVVDQAEVGVLGSGVEAEAGVVAPAAEAVADAVVEAQEIRHTLDAKSTEDWVLFDFGSGEVVVGDLTSSGWDVAFRRTKLLTNSGVTNPSGPGGALDLGEVPLDEATAPSAAAFIVDTLGGEDEDEPENAAAGRWYKYSFITHIVSVKPNTYLIRTGDENDALVQFDSYYCEDEEPGCITFRYRLVPSVAGG